MSTQSARPTLLVVIASTRPTRVGKPIADWLIGVADDSGLFDVEVADLAEMNLPMMDEPKHPRLREYTHSHTIAWSARVESADAVAFVMPEYNFSFTAPLKNAIDYLVHEWFEKPVLLASYGGVSAGTRAAAAIRVPLSSLGARVSTTPIQIPFAPLAVKDGIFTADEETLAGARAAITAVHRLVRG